MYRYIALFWNEHSESARAQALQAMERIEADRPGIACVMKGSGGAIYAQTDNPGYFEYSRSGPLVILGKLFHKVFAADTVPAQAFPDAASADSACSTQGRSLVEQYWGATLPWATSRIPPAGSCCAIRRRRFRAT